MGLWSDVEQILKEILENYNTERAQMNLVFFVDAMKHMRVLCLTAM